MRYIKTKQELNENSGKNNTLYIDSIDKFREFVDDYSSEILEYIHGESDGWNQKMSAINKILDDKNIEVSDDVWDDEQIEEIINNI